MPRFFLVPLVLLGLLVAAPTAVAVEADELDESGLVDEAIEGCELEPLCEEEAAEEAEEAEEAEAAEASSACPLRSAKGHAAVRKGRLRLTIGYTADEPVAAVIRLRYGSAKLGALQRHLGRSGVLRVVRPLKGKQGAKRLVVNIDAGSGCASRRLVLTPKR